VVCYPLLQPRIVVRIWDHVIGTTRSPSFPTTAGAFQTLHGDAGSGTTDAFVTRLNALGSELVYSTLLGATGSESGESIALDETGAAWPGGSTEAANFPTTTAAFDPTHNGGDDAFLAAALALLAT